jgi:hypothetical protein
MFIIFLHKFISNILLFNKKNINKNFEIAINRRLFSINLCDFMRFRLSQLSDIYVIEYDLIADSFSKK